MGVVWMLVHGSVYRWVYMYEYVSVYTVGVDVFVHVGDTTG